MTPEMITALCTGIVTIIAAVSALIVSIRTNKFVGKDSIIKNEKLDEIHVLVNSRLSKALTEIADLKATIADLREGKNEYF
jgi:cell division protein FtsB